MLSILISAFLFLSNVLNVLPMQEEHVKDYIKIEDIESISDKPFITTIISKEKINTQLGTINHAVDVNLFNEILKYIIYFKKNKSHLPNDDLAFSIHYRSNGSVKCKNISQHDSYVFFTGIETILSKNYKQKTDFQIRIKNLLKSLNDYKLN